MKTMNLIKVMCIALLMAASFAACKKDKDTTPETSAIQGKWVGKAQKVDGSESENLYFNVKEKNVFQLLDEDNPNEVDVTGTWKLTEGTKFEATFPDEDDPNATITFSATFDSKSGALVNGIAKSGDNIVRGSWQAYKW